MATIYKVDCPNRKPLFEGVQGENEARSIQFDITAWVEELGAGAVTATAKRPTDAQPYPVTIEQGDGNIVTWKPTSTDTAFEGVGSFQLEYTVDDVLAKTCIWSTQIAPSLDPAGDPPDPYDNWLASMREVAAAAQQSANDSAASAQQAAGEVTNAQTEVKNAEAWAVGTKGGVDVPSTDETYHNNAKYWAGKSNENQYGAYITKSASGSVASFSDGGDDIPMKSVKVAITPKQAGSGDPSPDNVRPITGWTDAGVYVVGVNLWDEEWEEGRYDTTTGLPVASTQIRCKNFVPVVPGTDYRIKTTVSAGLWIQFYDENKNILNRAVTDNRWSNANGKSLLYGNKVMSLNSECHYIKFYLESSYGTTYNHDISINYPSTDTEYHTYTGHTTPVPLGQTVYGGEVDVATGELTIEKVTKSGQITASTTQSYNNVVFGTVPKGADNKGDGNYSVSGAISNMYKVEVAPSEWDSSDNVGKMFCGAQLGNYWIGFEHGTTLEQMKSATENMVICYELATPITVQLTPTQVASLLGTNNVWSDVGDVEVEYRADPTLAYAELQALILENN